jgi:transcriptional regulator GlxA family with amidase domain
MTISAQVIETIVEWIDDNLHQPLRIDDIARHSGYSKWHLQRLFLQYKGRVWGAISANVSCCWRRAICAIPISGSTIFA